MLGKKVINQSLIYGLASLLINGSNFFLIPLYTHYLTSSEYGIISSVTIFSTLTTGILAFGLNGAVTRLYFEYTGDDFRRFLFSAFIFQVITASIIVGIFLISRGFFLDRVFENVPYDPYLQYGLMIGLTGIFSSIPLAFLQARSKALLYRLFTSTSFLIFTSLMILLVVVLKKGSFGAIQAALITNTIMAMGYAFYILRECKISFRFAYVRTALSFGLPLMVYVVFGTITEISSKYFIERYSSLSQLGIFNVAQQLAALIILVTNAINMAWIPMFYEEAGKDEQSPLFSQFANFFIFLLVFAGLGLSLLSPEIVFLFMSPAYNEVSLYIPFLVFAYIVGNGVWLLLINPITFAKKTIYLPVLTILSGILSIVLNILLIPRFGLMGAAVSISISYVILVLITFFIFKKYTMVKYNFRTLNGILLAGILIYLISIQISIENIIMSLASKLGLLILFLTILAYLKIYSIKQVKLFFK
jgi:O-antigen/teichoic acid export membrane protein